MSLKGLKKLWLFYYMNTVSGMHFESLFKRHVIASDSLYYHNSSKLIGFRFMEKYANAQRTTHIPRCGYKSSSQRIHLIEFDYWTKSNYFRYTFRLFWRGMLKRRNIWYMWVLFAHSDLFIHIFWQSRILNNWYQCSIFKVKETNVIVERLVLVCSCRQRCASSAFWVKPCFVLLFRSFCAW